MAEFEVNPHIFRQDFVPESNESADIGRIGRRPDTVRARHFLGDLFTGISAVFANLIATNATITNVTVTGSGKFIGVPDGYAKIISETLVPQPVPIPATDGGTGQTAVATGDILYGSATNVWSRRAIGSTGQLLGVSGGVPTWGVPVINGFNAGRLTKSGSNLVFAPYNGNQILVNSAVMVIPDAGATLAVGATLTEGGTPAASTTYFIYAYNNGGTLALQASATGHSTQAGTGVEIRTGDATRTLVGMARTTAGTAWALSDTQLFVISWFNRRGVLGTVFSPGFSDDTTASINLVALNASTDLEFLTWGADFVNLSTSGRVKVSVSGDAALQTLKLDGSLATRTGIFTSSTAGDYGDIVVVADVSAFEGYHLSQIYGNVTGGTGTWVHGELRNAVRVSG